MKTKARILAALSALTLFQCCTQLFTVSAAVPSVTAEVFQENVSADEQEAAAVIKEAIMNRTENFSVVTPKNGFTKEEIGGHLIYLACEETGKGNEGDYLRYSIKSYLCGIRTTESEYMINFTIEYGTTAEEEAALTEKISEINDYLALDTLTDYEKIRTIYKYAVSNIRYSENIKDPYAYTAYSAVFNGHAVCQGITQLLYRLYNDAGISCRIIAGLSRDLNIEANNGNHVWLIVKLDDKYYLLDPTWDTRLGGQYFRYFMKGTGDFDSSFPSTSHIAYNDNGLAFPDYNSQEFIDRYPISLSAYSEPVYSLGDIDGDNRVTSLDASVILAEYARISSHKFSSFSASQSKYADVNRDNIIDSVDASIVLSYYAAVSTNSYNSTLASYISTH